MSRYQKEYRFSGDWHQGAIRREIYCSLTVERPFPLDLVRPTEQLQSSVERGWCMHPAMVLDHPTRSCVTTVLLDCVVSCCTSLSLGRTTVSPSSNCSSQPPAKSSTLKVLSLENPADLRSLGPADPFMADARECNVWFETSAITHS